MRVKVLLAMTESGLEKKANRFLEDTSIEVRDIQYSSTIISYSLLITYEPRI